MIEEIEKIQKSFDESIETRPKALIYKNIVVKQIEGLVEQLLHTKNFPVVSNFMSHSIDVYTEACTQILIKEYMDNIANYEFSLFNSTILPIHCIAMVLEKHPFLINLIHRNITIPEWNEYRTKIVDGLRTLHGAVSVKSTIELLCDVNDYSPKSVVHNFRYLMGLEFEEDNVSIKYSDIIEKAGTDIGLLILHISKGVQPASVVMYKRIEKINKSLILNEEKVKRFVPIVMPDTIYEYANDYEVINENAKGFVVCVCYDDAKSLVDCTFSMATTGYPIEFLQRYLKGAVPKTLEREDIDIYLQEWFFEQFSDPYPPLEDLQKMYETLGTIASDNYSENVDICINKIIADKRINDIMINQKERGIFNTYVHGLKLLSKPRKIDVVNYIKRYIGDSDEW